MAEQKIGVVSMYFARISVAGVELSDTIHVGDTIHIKGHTTDVEQVVESMQIEHDMVEEARAGQSIGLKVIDRVRSGDQVYKAG
jgi:putative protease